MTLAISNDSKTDDAKTQASTTKAVKVKVLVLRGGGGHYATFLALRDVLAKQQPHWQLEPIFVDTLGAGTETQKENKVAHTIGKGSDQFYDLILKNGFGWVHLITVHIHKVLTWLNHRTEVGLLSDIWQQDPPDLVLSVVPFHNRALWASLQPTQPGTPVVTLLTDFADSPSAYWVEPSTDNYLICSTEKAVEQAITAGVAPNRVIKTSGLVIHPKFYRPRPEEIAAERQALGLEPHRLTGLVLFGANGSKAMLEVAKQLESFQDCLQLICLCGRNQAVADALRAKTDGQKRAIISFTEDIPHYMHLADFLIGKPGNVSVSEAIRMKLPPIVERNFLTLPQERYAADWVKEKQVGLTVASFKEIASAVETLIQPENFAHYQENLAAFDNQAVFEVPQILQRILADRYAKST
ncbi:MAG: glycosyltransferase [Cyanobacteria bacterium P01_D01_bin.44]